MKVVQNPNDKKNMADPLIITIFLGYLCYVSTFQRDKSGIVHNYTCTGIPKDMIGTLKNLTKRHAYYAYYIPKSMFTDLPE
jgi:hypothetical protein